MKMKKFILAICSVCLVGLGSCEKGLELGPYNSATIAQAFESDSDFANAVRGMYASALGGSYFGGSMISLPDILSDNVVVARTGRLSNLSFYEWRYTADGTWGLFATAYTGIRRANAILENIDRLPAGASKENYKAEALAFRAMAHFDLVRLYGKAYTQASDTDLGVPYVTSTDATLKPSRESVKTNFSKIETDLKAAEAAIGSANGIYRFNKAAVSALLSRVYLYEGKWQESADAATRSLALSSNPGGLADYARIWTDAVNTGVLLKLQIVDKDRITPGVEYSQSSASGVRNEYVVDHLFLQSFKANDVRTAASVRLTTFNGQPYNSVAKWFGRATGNANVTDSKVIRVAEVWLNLAESLANLGKNAEALTALNNLRKNRYTDFDAGNFSESGNALKTAIDLERRLEFAFEGHRLFDLKRKGNGISRSSRGDKADGTGTPARFLSLAATDYRLQLPLPSNELRVNSNIQQNPNY